VRRLNEQAEVVEDEKMEAYKKYKRHSSEKELELKQMKDTVETLSYQLS
jgi:hypothetical protein